MELLALRSPVAEPARPRALPPLRPAGGGSAVRLEDVVFHYPSRPRQAALDGITLDVRPGETVALVGPSGAGKSTVFQLLLRFYDAQHGRVVIDGVPVGEVSLAELRRRIGIVPQDSTVFSTSALENIRYGRPDASDADVEAAARAAFAHEFISALPEGYETRIGDGGVALSGGQRQRIALARAIIRDPRILILDEATNALDSLSEHAIQKALDRFSDGRTVVVIAHRLSTIERADTIIVLHEGRIAEQGNLRELVASGGLFSRMYSLQNAATRA
jgi:ATP-binding cassette subfamily B protein